MTGASGLRGYCVCVKRYTTKEDAQAPTCLHPDRIGHSADMKPCSAPAKTVTALLWKREGWRWLFLAETSTTLLLPEAGRRRGRPGFWPRPWWDPPCWQGWGSLFVLWFSAQEHLLVPSSWGRKLALVAHEDPFLAGYSQLYLPCDHCWQNNHVRPVLHCDTTAALLELACCHPSG